MGLFSGKCTSLNRLDGKTAVITGCNTGIGKVTAKDFFQRGARVIMACRNVDKANQALNDIKTECQNEKSVGELLTTELDLMSLKSVRRCANELLQNEERIDLLINNAGVMMCPKGTTEDGFETQFGTNHLGHFLLTMLLLPKIVQSTPARIVNVSSMAHVWGSIDFQDLNFKNKPYSSLQAYQQSKLANVLFTKELSRRLRDGGITDVNVYSLHPGVIATELGRHLENSFLGLYWIVRAVAHFFVKTPEQGAQTSIYCAVADECANETGLYYSDCALKEPCAAAKDLELAKKLFDVSVELVQLDENVNLCKNKS